jgi:hypothetical protein
VLANHGVNKSNGISIVLSVVLSALVIGWFSAGVLRARPVRVGIVWILLGVSGVAEVIGALVDPNSFDGGDWVGLASTLIEIGALCSFWSSDFYADQRDFPDDAVRPDITWLLAIAVVVGILGGLAGADASQVHVRLG